MHAAEKAAKIILERDTRRQFLVADKTRKEKMMEQVLRNLMGRKIDVSCGSGPILRGEVKEVRDGVLFLRDDDDKTAYVSINKIASIYECSDSSSRPGFIG